MANLAFRSATNAFDTSFAANTITANVPAGTAAGDAQLVVITGAALAPTAAPTYTTPSGWTLLASSGTFSLAGGVLNIRVWVFWRKAGSSEANQTFTASANCAMGVVRSSYQNPDPNGFAGQAVFGSGSGSSAAVGGLTTTRDNSLLQAFISQGVAQSASPATGFTERVDNATSGISMYDAIQAVAGASGVKSFPLAGAADYVWAFIEAYSNNVINVTESITFSDSVTGLLNSDREITESITFIDSQTALAELIAELAEIITFSDEVAAVYRQFDTIVESLTFTDSQDAVLESGAVAEETITFADSVDAVLNIDDTVEETITFEDVVAASSTSLNEIVETLTFEDAQGAAVHYSGALTESITFADVVIGTANYPSVLQEAINFVDSVTALAPSEMGVEEQITFQDSVAAQLHATETIDESITFQDVVQVSGGPEPAAPVGGSFALQYPRKKEKVDRILDDLLAAVEELNPTRTQERKVKQTIHRVVRKIQPDTINEFMAVLNVEKIEERVYEVVMRAAKKAKKVKRRRDDEIIMLML